jgi:hypothetical protein
MCAPAPRSHACVSSADLRVLALAVSLWQGGQELYPHVIRTPPRPARAASASASASTAATAMDVDDAGSEDSRPARGKGRGKAEEGAVGMDVVVEVEVPPGGRVSAVGASSAVLTPGQRAGPKAGAGAGGRFKPSAIKKSSS